MRKRDYITLEEYYALDAASDRRWEYWDGDIYCMSGSSDPNHGLLAGQIHGLLFNIFRPKGCRAFGEGQAVKCNATESGYIYPDVSAACNPQFEKHKERGIALLTNPVILIEVLSPDSINRDNLNKKYGYQLIQTVQDYLIVDPTKMCVIHWRSTVGDQWRKRTYESLDDVIILTCTDATLSLKDIYQDWKPYKV